MTSMREDLLRMPVTCSGQLRLFPCVVCFICHLGLGFFSSSTFQAFFITVVSFFFPLCGVKPVCLLCPVFIVTRLSGPTKASYRLGIRSGHMHLTVCEVY